MITQGNLEKIKKAVHQPLNWEDYNSTSVIEDTNCFSHSIGSTVTSSNFAYRLGWISAKKKIDEKYFSKEEVKDLFMADAEVLELGVEEILFEDSQSFLENIPELADNEHIVALFVTVYGVDEKIWDFHFLRYDKEIGWSEKRWGRKVNFIENISISWPTGWNQRLIGIFKITR